MKEVIRHLSPDTTEETISNSIEDFGFNVISLRQMTANRRAPHIQNYVEALLFLVTLTKTKKSREMFKLNSLKYIIIKAAS
jgi:hypothetical protein